MTHRPTAKNREEALFMIGAGIKPTLVAKILGINYKTFQRHYADEMEQGTAKAIATVAKSLFDMAMDGNVAAAIFWLKARAGWSEKFVVQTDRQTGVLKVPGPIDPDEWVEAATKYQNELTQQIQLTDGRRGANGRGNGHDG